MRHTTELGSKWERKLLNLEGAIEASAVSRMKKPIDLEMINFGVGSQQATIMNCRSSSCQLPAACGRQKMPYVLGVLVIELPPQRR